MKKRIIFLGAIAIIVVIFSIAIGSVFIAPGEILQVLGNKLFGFKLPESFNEANISIIWNIRIPRVLLAFLVGAALSIGGAVVQSLLKNPLASPFTLGVSSGASFGAGIVMATGFTLPVLGGFTLPMAGLFFGIVTVIAAVWLSGRVDRTFESSTIILIGMIFSLFINALLTFIAGLSGDKFEIIMRWQMGNFSAKGWNYAVTLFFVVIIGIIVIMCYTKELDILSFGDEQANAIGVEVKNVKWILLILTAILTGAAVSFAGVIGFIDLIAPHIVRKIFGARHKLVVPMSAVFGGTFMVFADVISRTIVSPKELPIGAVTALIGAPFFAYIYLRKGKMKG